MRAWAASRAVAVRVASSVAVGTGLGSLARRLPRSKVKGVGLFTVMGLVCVSRCREKVCIVLTIGQRWSSLRWMRHHST
jgi:hypothetical protein